MVDSLPAKDQTGSVILGTSSAPSVHSASFTTVSESAISDYSTTFSLLQSNEKLPSLAKDATITSLPLTSSNVVSDKDKDSSFASLSSSSASVKEATLSSDAVTSSSAFSDKDKDASSTSLPGSSTPTKDGNSSNLSTADTFATKDLATKDLATKDLATKDQTPSSEPTPIYSLPAKDEAASTTTSSESVSAIDTSTFSVNTPIYSVPAKDETTSSIATSGSVTDNDKDKGSSSATPSSVESIPVKDGSSSSATITASSISGEVESSVLAASNGLSAVQDQTSLPVKTVTGGSVPANKSNSVALSFQSTLISDKDKTASVSTSQSATSHNNHDKPTASSSGELSLLMSSVELPTTPISQGLPATSSYSTVVPTNASIAEQSSSIISKDIKTASTQSFVTSSAPVETTIPGSSGQSFNVPSKDSKDASTESSQISLKGPDIPSLKQSSPSMDVKATATQLDTSSPASFDALVTQVSTSLNSIGLLADKTKSFSASSSAPLQTVTIVFTSEMTISGSLRLVYSTLTVTSAALASMSPDQTLNGSSNSSSPNASSDALTAIKIGKMTGFPTTSSNLVSSEVALLKSIVSSRLASVESSQVSAVSNASSPELGLSAATKSGSSVINAGVVPLTSSLDSGNLLSSVASIIASHVSPTLESAMSKDSKDSVIPSNSAEAVGALLSSLQAAITASPVLRPAASWKSSEPSSLTAKDKSSAGILSSSEAGTGSKSQALGLSSVSYLSVSGTDGDKFLASVVNSLSDGKPNGGQPTAATTALASPVLSVGQAAVASSPSAPPNAEQSSLFTADTASTLSKRPLSVGKDSSYSAPRYWNSSMTITVSSSMAALGPLQGASPLLSYQISSPFESGPSNPSQTVESSGISSVDLLATVAASLPVSPGTSLQAASDNIQTWSAIAVASTYASALYSIGAVGQGAASISPIYSSVPVAYASLVPVFNPDVVAYAYGGGYFGVPLSWQDSDLASSSSASPSKDANTGLQGGYSPETGKDSTLSVTSLPSSSGSGSSITFTASTVPTSLYPFFPTPAGLSRAGSSPLSTSGLGSVTTASSVFSGSSIYENTGGGAKDIPTPPANAPTPATTPLTAANGPTPQGEPSIMPGDTATGVNPANSADDLPVPSLSDSTPTAIALPGSSPLPLTEAAGALPATPQTAGGNVPMQGTGLAVGASVSVQAYSGNLSNPSNPSSPGPTPYYESKARTSLLPSFAIAMCLLLGALLL